MHGQCLYSDTEQWQRAELNDVNMKSRKTITMYGALHPKSDVEGL